MNNLITRTNRLLSPSFFDELFFKDFFEDVFLPLPSIKKIEYPVDIYENDKGLVLDIAAIGLDKPDIKILMEDDILSVSYQKAEQEKKEDYYAYRGIARRSFKLSWKIPEQFDINKTKASIDKGLLKIVIPKVIVEKKVKQVEVPIQ